MRKINESLITSTSAMFYKQGTWSHLQKAYIEPISETIKTMIGDGYSASKVYILTGCRNSGSGSTYNISSGSVFYNGEVYLVDATTFTVTTGVPVATIVTTQNTTDYSADPCLFSDGVYKNVHDINKVVIAEGVSGSGISNYSNFDHYPFEHNYQDLHSSVTVNGAFTGYTLIVRRYFDGTVQVVFNSSYSGTISANTVILTGLPQGNALTTPVLSIIDGNVTALCTHNGLVDSLTNSVALSNTYNTFKVNYFYKISNN